MPLTMAQIEDLLQQARESGDLDGDELEALEWFLVDRAAELDGATRLDVALSMLPLDEQQAADTFLSEINTLRRGIVQRGADIVGAIDDAEWERLIGE